jgi:hypothetical protein
MKCRICGGVMESRITDLPFKLGDTAIVYRQSHTGVPMLPMWRERTGT